MDNTRVIKLILKEIKIKKSTIKYLKEEGNPMSYLETMELQEHRAALAVLRNRLNMLVN